MASLVALAGCHGGRAPAPHDGAVAADLAPSPSVLVYAGRCGECHGKMYREWAPSAHARASKSARYLAARSHDQACDRCHLPLMGVVAADDPVAQEGITCEACHAVAAVELGQHEAHLVLHANDNVKYGPLCDAKNHYFHKMGCSPLHTESKLCASCHEWYRGTLPVFTEYEEWLASPAAASGVECQGCHMPTERAAAAEGAAPRPSVPHHGFLGREGLLRRGAVELELVARRAGKSVQVTATLVARHAGHRLPTGAPEHRLVLRLRLVGKKGVTLAETQRSYGRRLGDARNQPAPFWKATRLIGDDRLAPDVPRVETWQIAVAAGRAVAAELFYDDVASELQAPGEASRRTRIAGKTVTLRSGR
jgi:hypothetical protein